MATLDGSIDRLIHDERIRMQEFLRLERLEELRENGTDRKIIEELGK